MKFVNVSTVASLLLLAGITGCQQVDNPTDLSNLTNTTSPGDTPSTTPTPTAHSSTTPNPKVSSTPSASGFSKCTSNDPNHMCLAVKIVTYKDSKGTPTLSQSEAIKMMNEVNGVWDTCNIEFQVEDYDAITPSTYGLSYGAASEKEATSIRREFSNNSSFLVAVTGPWSGVTIAWTEMPGYAPFGTIVEADYGDNPFTVGHELGHYMGLYHINNISNLMNPYIGSNTKGLTSSQCSTARSTNYKYWGNMLRH